ncbi:hypothetical protein GCM10010441_03090 [Kitasatospora paracochleata]|uniref:Competence protein CoiA n=1 Tax=Kitasatospora paracochleata TaxID=58354 RepID=A0ABT1J2B0_9ACTN|nr:competence protein CoiA family protein [Kitasatospora paracochleata]MCP2311574.1 competence protein CoiA [Kitasatospora paracochleata]
MGFTALHAEQGRLDASQDDLGCDWEWPAIHRARPRVPLACPECGHGVHPKVSSGGLRFFAHDAGAPRCALAQESMEHHLLKLELAQAVRAGGWFAELEVRAPDGAWRADVMAASPDGGRRMAWEAQLSPITPDDIRARTGRFAEDGVRVCWVGVRSRPWLGTVPSVLAAPPGTDGTPWKVVGGLARFDLPNWLPANATLRDFVAWVLADRVVGHRFGRPQRLDGRTLWPAAWTAPRYAADAAEWEGLQRKLDGQRVQAMVRQLRPGEGWRGTTQASRHLLRDPHRVMVRSWRLSVPADERRRMREAASAWVLASGTRTTTSAGREASRCAPATLMGPWSRCCAPSPPFSSGSSWPGSPSWLRPSPTGRSWPPARPAVRASSACRRCADRCRPDGC